MPPLPRLPSNVRAYCPIVAPPCAESVTVIVHAFDDPLAGTVGVKVTPRVSDSPRLPKYSTDSGCAEPSAPAAVSVAGRLAPSVTFVVGSPAVWLTLMTTGCNPIIVSRGSAGMLPSELAGQPSNARPELVSSTPELLGWNEPVVVIIIGSVAAPLATAAAVVTGSIPRPFTAISSAFEVVTSDPVCPTRRLVTARTPPAD